VNWLPATVSGRFYALLLLLLACAPFIFEWANQPFYLDLLSRALILGIAAISLNLILGFGGMVSLGHAAYIGIGAYCVGIPSYYDFYNGWLHLALALSVSASFALVTGAISLRTKGVCPVRQRQLCACHRGHQPAYQRRVFHHDYDGLQPDGVLHLPQSRRVRCG